MRLRIGSRKSPLALVQAEWVGAELKKRNPSLDVSLHGITTQGDRDQKASLQAMGGKGVFVKDIESALLRKEIDVAVHSLKDVPQALPEELILGPFPRREDPREAFLSSSGLPLRRLSPGARIGTSSPRRMAQIRHIYGDKYRCEPLRGNIETRLKKLAAGEIDALIMAVAGLKRIGAAEKITEILNPNDFLPAPGQGCLGLECCAANRAVLSLLETLRHPASDAAARAERAFLRRLGGGCLLPVGAFAQVEGDDLRMSAMIMDMKGMKALRANVSGYPQAAENLGISLAEKLLKEGGAAILAMR